MENLVIPKFVYKTIKEEKKIPRCEAEALLNLTYEITEAQGKYRTTIRKLAKQWQWPNTTVYDFLQKLVVAEFITIKTSKKGSEISFKKHKLFKF